MKAELPMLASAPLKWQMPRGAILLAPLVIFLAVFFIWPVAQLLALSIGDGSGGATLAEYGRLFHSPIYLRVLATTFKFAAWTTLACVVAAYPLAYVLADQAGRRSWLMLCVLLPFWTSFLVRTFAWIVLLGRNGAINSWLQGLGITRGPLDLLYNAGSVYVGLIHAMLPLAALTMAASMQSIDRRLVNAARTLGASPSQAFWRVYFPLSIPGAASAGILVFVSTVGFFITPALMGGGSDVTIAQVIIEEVANLNWKFAGALGVLLLSTTVACFLVYDRLFGLSSVAPGALTTAQPAGATARLGSGLLRRGIEGAAWISSQIERALAGSCREAGGSVRVGLPRLLWIVAAAELVFLAAPSFFVVPISFTQSSFIEWPPHGFSMRWYEEFLASPLWLSALARSLIIGVSSATLATLLGLPAAFAIAFAPLPGRAAIVAFALSPMIVPRILIAVAIFYLYARVGLVGTSVGLVIGHTVLALPYTVITMVAILKAHDQRYDQAARTLGASPARTLWHVTLPLIRPGLIASFLFAFVTSFDEITVALFVTGGLMTTLPKQMWDGAVLNVTPVITAASTITLAVVTAVILLTQALQRRLAHEHK